MRTKGRAHAVTWRAARGVACVLALALSCGAIPRLALATELIGVNQTGLGWMPAEQRKVIISNMQRNGVRVVRIPLHQPFARVIDTITEIIAYDIRVVLVVSLNQKPYFAPSVPIRPGFDRVSLPCAASTS